MCVFADIWTELGFSQATMALHIQIHVVCKQLCTVIPHV